MNLFNKLIQFIVSIFNKRQTDDGLRVDVVIDDNSEIINNDEAESNECDEESEIERVQELTKDEVKEDTVAVQDTVVSEEKNIVSEDLGKDAETEEDEKQEELFTCSKDLVDKFDDVVVFLCPGHCKSTPGKHAPDKSIYEWMYAREIVKMIEDEFDRLGVQHWNVHPEDDWVDSAHSNDSKDLALRAQRVNAKYKELKAKGKTAFMLEIHLNAAGNGQWWYKATGWEAYTTKGQNNSDKLAECLYDAADEILKPLGKKYRTDLSDGDRDKESNFYLIKNANCVCSLTENFFQDGETDIVFLKSEEGKNAIRNIHVRGALNYIERYC